jgi:hypothetical protein
MDNNKQQSFIQKIQMDASDEDGDGILRSLSVKIDWMPFCSPLTIWRFRA